MSDLAVSTHPIADTKVLQGQNIAAKVRARTGRHSVLLPCLCLVLVLSIIFYIWTRVEVVKLGYEISSALREKEAAIIAHNELKLEIATLCSAQQVERRAREKMGMNLPRKEQLIIIK
ncbi:MAG: cell division protein FtsL [Deltaproteobacteria bacterium]|nr:MAG: cell division protein FtsL [Deltaproteobacteria bacterium]